MATTQMPIEGVFDRDSGRLIGISDEMQEIAIPTLDSQGRMVGADGTHPNAAGHKLMRDVELNFTRAFTAV